MRFVGILISLLFFGLASSLQGVENRPKNTKSVPGKEKNTDINLVVIQPWWLSS